MSVLNQILSLPYAYLWLPSVVFVIVVGSLYWLMRPASVRAESAASANAPSVAAAAAKNQRETHRRQGNTVQVHVATPDDKKAPEIASVLDRSMGGMRLALFQELKVGFVLSVRPINADNIVPWVDLEVRSCKVSTEVPDQFEIGCQYVKSPPYSIQLLFG